jgi:auxin response factor
MATESFHRVLQGQESMQSRTRGVACSHLADAPKFQTSDNRTISVDMRNCLFNDAQSGHQQRHSTEFPYQPRGFSESVRFSEVLQGQEMSRVVPLYHGNASDYVHRPAATQGYSLQRFTTSAAEVCSPSSVFMFNQTMVPQPEVEGTIILRDAAPLEEVQRKTEDWALYMASNAMYN